MNDIQSVTSRGRSRTFKYGAWKDIPEAYKHKNRV